MVKRKHEWPAIWGRAINGPDAPPLDLTCRASSQVWRVELRAGKRHLKDIWDINGWTSFYEMLPGVFHKMMDDISYTQPCSDTNRSRWPNHPIWQAVRQTVETDLFDTIPTLSPEEFVEIKKAQKLDELIAQILGLSVTVAAIKGVSAPAFDSTLKEMAKTLGERASDSKKSLSERLAAAAMKYQHLRP